MSNATTTATAVRPHIKRLSADHPPASTPSSARNIRFEVKWSDTSRGVWYLWSPELETDAVLMRPVLEQAGYARIPKGHVVICDLDCSSSLFEAVRVRGVEAL